MFQSEPVGQSRRHSVSGAGTVDIERLDANHRDAVETLLLTLDQDARKGRFGGVTCDAAIRAHAKRAVDEAPVLLGAFAGRRLCGMLEANACDADSMEVALVVEPGLRRQGIGWSLLRAVIEHGRRNGVARLQLNFAGDNWAMRRIVQKADARLDLKFGQICADVELCGVSTTIDGPAVREIFRS